MVQHVLVTELVDDPVFESTHEGLHPLFKNWNPLIVVISVFLIVKVYLEGSFQIKKERFYSLQSKNMYSLGKLSKLQCYYNHSYCWYRYSMRVVRG